jgi:Mn-dependent DtxR family transcriptional regulator
MNPIFDYLKEHGPKSSSEIASALNMAEKDVIESLSIMSMDHMVYLTRRGNWIAYSDGRYWGGFEL